MVSSVGMAKSLGRKRHRWRKWRLLRWCQSSREQIITAIRRLILGLSVEDQICQWNCKYFCVLLVAWLGTKLSLIQWLLRLLVVLKRSLLVHFLSTTHLSHLGLCVSLDICVFRAMLRKLCPGWVKHNLVVSTTWRLVATAMALSNGQDDVWESLSDLWVWKVFLMAIPLEYGWLGGEVCFAVGGLTDVRCHDFDRDVRIERGSLTLYPDRLVASAVHEGVFFHPSLLCELWSSDPHAAIWMPLTVCHFVWQKMCLPEFSILLW